MVDFIFELKDESSIPQVLIQKPIFGLVGAIKLIAGHFLIVITSKSRVGYLNEQEVLKVDQFELIPYFRSENTLSEKEVPKYKIFPHVYSVFS
jgi:hypothetical protein